MTFMEKHFGPMKPARAVPPKTTTNMGGNPAYEKSLKEKIIQAAYCGFPGRTFYANQKDIVNTHVIEVLREGARELPEFTAEALARSRTEGLLKFPSQVGLVLLRGRPDLISDYFDRLIKIPTDLFAAYTYLQGTTGTTGGRAWKRATGAWLNRHMTPFWAVKYPGGNAGFSMKDVIKVSHPIPGNQALNDLYKYIVSGERCKNNAYLEAVRALPECSSEKAAELIRQFKLPQEAVIGRMQKMDYIVWHALADTMPLFALLRSLSAISRGMGVPDTVRLMRPRFEDSEALSKSQILPFRFMIAADEFESSAGTKPLVDLVRGAMEMSVANMPEIKEQTIFAMDTSASMQETEGKRKAFHTAIYMGMAMKKRNPDTVKLITFDSDARPFEFSSYDSVYTQAKRLYPDGGSTETEKVMRFVTRDIKNLMIATDGEENNGSNIARELASRRFTGQKLRTFIIDISAYTGAGKLINDNSEDSFYIYGCSDQILKYVALAANGFGTLVDSIDAEVARRGRN